MKPFMLSVAAFALLGSFTAANAQSTTMTIYNQATYGVGLDGYSSSGVSCPTLPGSIGSGGHITDSCTSTGSTIGSRTLTYGQSVNNHQVDCQFSLMVWNNNGTCTATASAVATNGYSSRGVIPPDAVIIATERVSRVASVQTSTLSQISRHLAWQPVYRYVLPYLYAGGCHPESYGTLFRSIAPNNYPAILSLRFNKCIKRITIVSVVCFRSSCPCLCDLANVQS